MGIEGELPVPDLCPELLARYERYLALHPGESPKSIADYGIQDPAGNTKEEFWVELIAQVRAFDRDNGFHFLKLARLYEEAGWIDRARTVLEQLERTGYRFLGYYDHASFYLSCLEADIGNYDEALRHYRRCLTNYPEEAAEIGFYVATVYHQQGRFAEAVPLYDRFLEHHRGSGDAEAMRKLAAKIGLPVRIPGYTERAVSLLRADAANGVAFRGRREWPVTTCGLKEVQDMGGSCPMRG